MSVLAYSRDRPPESAGKTLPPALTLPTSPPFVNSWTQYSAHLGPIRRSWAFLLQAIVLLNDSENGECCFDTFFSALLLSRSCSFGWCSAEMPDLELC